MSLFKIQINVCSGCGFDVATVAAVSPLGFEVVCPPEDGGCGCCGCVGDTEAEAVKLWNAGLVTHCGGVMRHGL